MSVPVIPSTTEETKFNKFLPWLGLGTAAAAIEVQPAFAQATADENFDQLDANVDATAAVFTTLVSVVMSMFVISLITKVAARIRKS